MSNATLRFERRKFFPINDRCVVERIKDRADKPNPFRGKLNKDNIARINCPEIVSKALVISNLRSNPIYFKKDT